MKKFLATVVPLVVIIAVLAPFLTSCSRHSEPKREIIGTYQNDDNTVSIQVTATTSAAYYEWFFTISEKTPFTYQAKVINQNHIELYLDGELDCFLENSAIGTLRMHEILNKVSELRFKEQIEIIAEDSPPSKAFDATIKHWRSH